MNQSLNIPSLLSSLDSALNSLGFNWRQCTTTGLVICAVLGVISLIGWTAILGRFYALRRARRANAKFLAALQAAPHPLAIFQSGETFERSPFFHIYLQASRELAYHLVGIDQPSDPSFAARLQGAGRITPSQMNTVLAAAEQGISEAGLRFEQRLGLVAIALNGAPFIGVLGTVWGVMDSFASLAKTPGGSPLHAMAPGIGAAMITTVAGLLVAIPTMLGYNLLVNRIREMVVRLENYGSELCSRFDRRYVDHQVRREELPSLGALGPSKLTAFSASPSATVSMAPRTPPSTKPITLSAPPS
jgi:biopolymer transport protein TolQ